LTREPDQKQQPEHHEQEPRRRGRARGLAAAAVVAALFGQVDAAASGDARVVVAGADAAGAHAERLAVGAARRSGAGRAVLLRRPDAVAARVAVRVGVALAQHAHCALGGDAVGLALAGGLVAIAEVALRRRRALELGAEALSRGADRIELAGV